MATYAKTLLSSSSTGVPTFVTVVSPAPGTLIHSTGTSASVIDEVWLYACNTSTSPILLTLCIGGNSPQFLKPIIMPPQSGDVLILAGQPLTGTGSAVTSIHAFAATASQINISGYVNRIS